MITEQGIEAAQRQYDHTGCMKAALEAYEKSKWRPIEEAGAFDRIIVAGWQKPKGTTAGYWWYHEDVTDQNGKPMDHPEATKFYPMQIPPQGDEG